VAHQLAEKITLEAIEGSSLVVGAGYNPAKQILALRFKTDNSIHHYAGVPSEVALEFYGSASKGTYYGARIKGKYTGARMTGQCPGCRVEGWIGEACPDCALCTYQERPRQARGA